MTATPAELPPGITQHDGMLWNPKRGATATAEEFAAARVLSCGYERIGCITKAPYGGECAGKSPVDRAKQGLKRSELTDGYGVPVGVVPAAANDRDHTLLPATLDTLAGLGPLPQQVTVHLDDGYDYAPVRAELTERGLHAQIARRGVPAPVPDRQAVGSRTHQLLAEQLQ